jgi:hypothetical protein
MVIHTGILGTSIVVIAIVDRITTPFGQFVGTRTGFHITRIIGTIYPVIAVFRCMPAYLGTRHGRNLLAGIGRTGIGIIAVTISRTGLTLIVQCVLAFTMFTSRWGAGIVRADIVVIAISWYNFALPIQWVAFVVVTWVNTCLVAGLFLLLTLPSIGVTGTGMAQI